MIDVEAKVFNYVYPYVTAVTGFPAGNFKSQYVPNPAAFPFASLMEMDNVTYTSRRTNSDTEEYAVITYEANVYAMTKAQCRQVMSAIDTGMTALGFTRISMQFIPNLADQTLYRLIARFRAAVNQGHTIFRKW